MTYVEGGLVVLLSFAMALLSEGISWLLVFRTEEYQVLKDKIARGDKKLEERKESMDDAAANKKKQQQKLDSVQEQVKADKQAMHVTRLKATLANAVLMITTYLLVTHLYDELVLARLPYDPISYVIRITNRGLESRKDTHEVSVTFLYILCSLSVRANVQKFFGNGPPASEKSWTTPMA